VSALASLPIAALLIVLEATHSLAGRPLVVDDAAPVAPGHLELEFGFSHARPAGGGSEQAWPVMTVAYGMIEWLEIGAGIQRVNNNDPREAPVKGFEDLHIATKFSISEETEALPAAAFSLDVSVPTANRAKGLSTGNSDQAFTLILSKGYAPGGFHLNSAIFWFIALGTQSLKISCAAGSRSITRFSQYWLSSAKCLALRAPARAQETKLHFSSDSAMRSIQALSSMPPPVEASAHREQACRSRPD